MAGKTETVDDYLAALPDDQREALSELRDAIREAAPEATEKISYHMPMYMQQGHLVGFAAFKNHLSMMTTSTTLPKEMAKELERWEINNSVIKFTADNPLPKTLVKRIVKQRLKENAERKES